MCGLVACAFFGTVALFESCSHFRGQSFLAAAGLPFSTTAVSSSGRRMSRSAKKLHEKSDKLAHISIMEMLKMLLFTRRACSVPRSWYKRSLLRMELMCPKLQVKRLMKLDGNLAVQMRRNMYFADTRPNTDPTGDLN